MADLSNNAATLYTIDLAISATFLLGTTILAILQNCKNLFLGYIHLGLFSTISVTTNALTLAYHASLSRTTLTTVITLRSTSLPFLLLAVSSFAHSTHVIFTKAASLQLLPP